MRRVLVSKGLNVLSTNLVPIAKYKFPQVESICGVQWSIFESLNHHGMTIATPSSIIYIDVVGDGDRGAATLNNNSETGLEWTELTSEKILFQFHKGGVHSLSLATQSNTFVSGSFDDSTVRFWDYNTPSSFHSAEVIESFLEKKDENPFHVDMHPSGLFVACACEYEVKEYAVTDSCMDLTRRISVKQPFTGPTGIPFMVTQPVSLVKYSHGGQYLAVVTGKLAQIFHLYSKDYNMSGTVGENFVVILHNLMIFMCVFYLHYRQLCTHYDFM
jgi:WD40 repeat protein